MDLQGLSILCDKTLGGYNTLEYAPLTWLSPNVFVQNSTTGVWLAEPSFNSGKSFLTLPFLKMTDRPFDSTANGTKFGSLSDALITATLPALKPAAALELQKMQTLRWFIIRITDKAGIKWTAGTPDNPLEFHYSSVGGKSADSANHVTVKFTGKLRNPFIPL